MIITRMLHDRHHASRRNPYNEVECSDHYTRAMSSHGSFLAACGYEYHGPKGHLGFAPRLSPDHFKAPFTTAEGWGTFEQKREGTSRVEKITVHYGHLRLTTLSFVVPENRSASKVQVSLNGVALEASLSMSGSRALVTISRQTTIDTGGILEIVLA
jgi:non-lysosomal glucosylceramidase